MSHAGGAFIAVRCIKGRAGVVAPYGGWIAQFNVFARGGYMIAVRTARDVGDAVPYRWRAVHFYGFVPGRGQGTSRGHPLSAACVC